MNVQEQPWAEDSLDLREIFMRLWNRKWSIIALALLSGAIAAGIGYSITPVYRAQAVMVSAASDRNGLSGMINSAFGSLGNLASFATGNLAGSDAAVEEALAVMRSRQFTEKFIERNNLLPELFADDWDAAKKAWKVPAEDRPTMAKAYKRFSKRYREVSRDKKTGLVTVSIDWPNRPRAAVLVNDMISQINDEMRARAIAQSEASLKYLNTELTTTQVVDTREAINRLIEGQIRQRMIASVTQEYAFRVVDRALTPDLSDKVRPKKALMILGGLIFGGFIGCLWAYFREAPVRR